MGHVAICKITSAGKPAPCYWKMGTEANLQGVCLFTKKPLVPAIQTQQKLDCLNICLHPSSINNVSYVTSRKNCSDINFYSKTLFLYGSNKAPYFRAAFRNPSTKPHQTLLSQDPLNNNKLHPLCSALAVFEIENFPKADRTPHFCCYP